MIPLTLPKVSLEGMVTVAADTPWRFILVGEAEAGKTTLLRALEHKDPAGARKTQMVDYSGWGIDTPGEFSQMGLWRRILTSIAFDAQVIVVVQDATRATSYFPPNYFLTYPHPIIGVVSKLDDPSADLERAVHLLQQAGVTGKVYFVSALTGLGVSELRDDLLNQNY